MKIAVYGIEFQPEFIPSIKVFFSKLDQYNVSVVVYSDFLEYITKNANFTPYVDAVFTNSQDLESDTDFFFSIGGDGTFLQSASFVHDKGIPIVGLNSGRLGFLADISKDEVAYAIDALFNRRYHTELRTTLLLNSKCNLFGSNNFALNEFTVAKRDSGSMITINAMLNGEYLNTYWADGLIISTPTGSTAYSMAAGGPIVVPTAKNFIITPISPHNLTVRPLVISDNSELTLTVEGRYKSYLASLDFRYEVLHEPIELKISRAPFTIGVVTLSNNSFSKTLRNKLMWGQDIRN